MKSNEVQFIICKDENVFYIFKIFKDNSFLNIRRQKQTFYSKVLKRIYKYLEARQVIQEHLDEQNEIKKLTEGTS